MKLNFRVWVDLLLHSCIVYVLSTLRESEFFFSPLFLRDLLFLNDVHAVCTRVLALLRSRGEHCMLGPLELELQAVVSHPMC